MFVSIPRELLAMTFDPASVKHGAVWSKDKTPVNGQFSLPPNLLLTITGVLPSYSNNTGRERVFSGDNLTDHDKTLCSVGIVFTHELNYKCMKILVIQ